MALAEILGSPNLFSQQKKCIEISNPDNGLVFDGFAGSGTTAHAVIQSNRENNKRQRFLLSEIGSHFDSAILPRIQKATYSSDWKDGKPVSRDGISHAFKYIRLESYEDALNNLRVAPKSLPEGADPSFKRDYMLSYALDTETAGSPSLLNVEMFDDPTAYKMKIKVPGSDETREQCIDLIETFNWLIGLHVEHLDRWRGFNGTAKREPDPELPHSTDTRLILDGKLTEAETAADGEFQFRKIEGYTLTIPGDMESKERTLVIWRKLTGNLERDNLMLDEWFKRNRLNTADGEFAVIYVNGSNNLRQDGKTRKVRLLEDAFHAAMWDVED